MWWIENRRIYPRALHRFRGILTASLPGLDREAIESAILYLDRLLVTPDADNREDVIENYLLSDAYVGVTIREDGRLGK